MYSVEKYAFQENSPPSIAKQSDQSFSLENYTICLSPKESQIGGLLLFEIYKSITQGNINMNIPKELTLHTLPVLTQYQLQRLIEGDTNPVANSKLKSERSKKGRHEEAFNIGLALSLFRLLQEFNSNIKEEV